MAIMDDFVGFSFNNHHSSEYGILKVSDGSRYQETLIPTSEDYTVDIPGGDGQYYFGSNYKTREFSIQIAFDSVTEINLRKIRQWLGINTVGELIFDEEPYKVYMAKVSSSPTLSYICFLEGEKGNKKRIYKGEGQITFQCFYPYAHARKTFDEEENRTGVAGKDWYESNNYNGIDEWIESSGLLNTLPFKNPEPVYDTYIQNTNNIHCYNPGDIEVPFILSFDKTSAGLFQVTFSNNISSGSFTIEAKLPESENGNTLNGDETEPTEPSGYVPVTEIANTINNNSGTITIDTYKNTITFKYPLNTESSEELEGTTISSYFLLTQGKFFNIPTEFEKDNPEQVTDISVAIRNNPGNVETGEIADSEITNIKIEYDYLYL